MIRTLINIAVFLAGLGAVCRIGAGYVGSNPLGLAITALVGIIYLAGALELYRYQRATATLDHALAATTEPPADLAAWLAPLHPSLRNATRLRIAGERVALPGPALTPYLVGLLVLLGMLGTFLGMVATLRGTGIALESATDLQAIRASLAAPVKGLGFAFGTSVAGVAASAMLGLLSALCRRERIQAGQALDARIASTLRPHSLAHQREASFQLLQRQAEGMPALVDRLQAMLAAMAQHSQAVNDGLAQQSRQLTDALTRQSQTLADTLTRQSDTLAERLDRQSQTLASSLDEQSRRLGASLGEHSQTLAASLTRQSDTLSDTVARQSSTLAQTLTQQGESLAATLTQQGAALSDGLARQGDTLAATLTGQNASLATALTQQGESLASTLAGETRELAARLDQQGRTVADALGQHSQAMAERLAAGQDAFHEKAAQAYTGLAASVRQTLNDSVAASAQAAGAAIQPAVQATLAGLASETAAWRETIGQAGQQQLAELSGRFEASTAGVAGIWNDALARHQQASESLAESLRSAQQQLAAHFEQRSAALLDTVAARLQGATDEVRDGWRDAVTRQEQAASQQGQTVAEAAGAFARHTAELLHAVEQSQTQLQAELAARDAQRESAWTHALEAMAAQLRTAWQETGAQTAEQQREICATLAQTAQDISSQSREHATRTVAEIGQLLEAAAQAPRAAADVVAELRQKLVDSMERDNAMLEERSRLLATVETLLGAVNHASSEQREAIDALVASSADLLERVGARFADSIESGAGRLEAASAQATASAADVASLGEAFGAAAQVFGAANDRLAEQLGRIETALDKSLARSDEQLAYYVAQAREVVDLSVLSQKQILEDLQRLAQQPEPAGAEAAETP